MYVPRHFAVDDLAEVAAFVAAVGAADLVTVGADGTPRSTLVPVLWDLDEDGGRPVGPGRLVAHVAAMNDQWDDADGARCLAVVHGPQAYVSPSWYAAKAEHGRVVPTWNYVAVHLTGTVRVSDDPSGLREVVGRLTDRHEAGRPAPWSVTDAPEAFVAGQLRAIRAVTLEVETVEAKAKLSQNRSDADRAGVLAGLRADGTPGALAVADRMDRPAHG